MALDDLDKNLGLYGKYHVRRLNDWRNKHDHCRYYVLDLNHDRHAQPAIRAYIESCKNEYPRLALELTKLLDTIDYDNQQGSPTGVAGGSWNDDFKKALENEKQRKEAQNLADEVAAGFSERLENEKRCRFKNRVRLALDNYKRDTFSKDETAEAIFEAAKDYYNG